MSAMKSTDIQSMLKGYQEQIKMALPKHITPERIIQIATTVATRNPELLKCTKASFVGAVMQASILGFKPVESFGHCYFVPYWNKEINGKEVQFQIGYKGYKELAYRSGQIKMLYAEVVCENDDFEYELGLDPKLYHKPQQNNRGDITHVYAVAHYKEGGHNFVVLSREEVERLRMRSPMQKDKPAGPWRTDYAAMAKAKAIKQLSKYMPMSEELQQAVSADEAVVRPDTFHSESYNYPKTEDQEAEEVVETTEDQERANEYTEKIMQQAQKKEEAPVDKDGQTTIV